MKEKILEIIKRRGGDIAITALIAQLGEKARGEMWIGLPEIKGKKSNIWYACGVSETFCEALKALEDEGRVEREPTSFLVAMIDGGLLYKLPIAKRPIAYKSEHWMPLLVKIKKSNKNISHATKKAQEKS